MFSKTVLVSFLLALTSFTNAAALPSESLEKRSEGFLKLDFNVVNTSENNTVVPIQKRDQAHPVPLENKNVYYIAELFFGSDYQKIGIDIDTGSSDLWVIDSESGIQTTYGSFDHTQSSSFEASDEPFEIHYLDKSYAVGKYSSDAVSFSPNGPTIQNLTFGDATSVQNFTYGVFGVGFKSLEATTAKYDNFPAALKDQGLTEKAAYSIYLNTADAAEGSIIFGGIDNAKYTGELHTYPSASTQWFQIQSKSLSLNGKDVPGPSFILDSGSTIGALNTATLKAVAELVGATNYDEVHKFYYWDSFDDIPDAFTVEFEGLSVNIPQEDLLWIRVTSDYNFVPALAFLSATDLNILGDNFLRHVYAVFDLDDATASLANVKYTADTNITVIS